jgi:hypothetical protein
MIAAMIAATRFEEIACHTPLATCLSMALLISQSKLAICLHRL